MFVYFPLLLRASSFTFLLSLFIYSLLPALFSSSFSSSTSFLTYAFSCLHTHTHTHTYVPDCSRSSLHRLKLMVDLRACTPASLSIKPPRHHHSHTLLPSRPTNTLVLLPYIWSWADRQVPWPVVEGKWGAIMASPVQQEWQTWEWTLMAPDRPHGAKPANWSHRCVDVPPLVHSHCLWASRGKLQINGLWSWTDICFSLFPWVSFSVSHSSFLLWCLSFRLTTAALALILSPLPHSLGEWHVYFRGVLPLWALSQVSSHLETCCLPLLTAVWTQAHTA